MAQSSQDFSGRRKRFYRQRLRDITVIVYTTNTTTLDKKVIAKEVKKEVVKGITKDQNDKDKTKGAA